MNSKTIYTIVFLSAAMTIVVLNYDIFYPEGNVDQTIDDSNSYTAESYEDEVQQSFWDKMFNKLKPDVEPEITLGVSEATVLDTELEELTDEDLILKFGAKAYDENGNTLPITVTKKEKSDTLIVVTFTATTDQEVTKSIDGHLIVDHNAHPKLTLENRIVEISKRKYERYSDEQLTNYIIRKSNLKCEDTEDGKLNPTIDLSPIKDEVGEYKLEISATDSDGQSSTINVILEIT